MEFLRTSSTEVWTPTAVVPLIQFADCVRPIANTGLNLLGLPGIDPPPDLMENLRSFDSIVSWYGAQRGDFRAALSAIARHVEFLAALPPPASSEHCADFFAKQVGAPLPAIPRIHCSGISPGRYAVIQPFSGSPRKNWPLSLYRELADRLPVPVRWCAGPEEILDDAVRFDDLYQLGRWIAGAALYIGNDSGITHLAAAVGPPLLALFGPTDPALWGPRGDRVRMVHDRLEAISVDRVLAEAEALLR